MKLIVKDVGAGMGKTHDEFRNHLRASHTLYVTPSIDVAGTYHRELTRAHPRHSHQLITSETQTAVVQAIHKAMTLTHNVIITTQAFELMDISKIPANWWVVMDDALMGLGESNILFSDAFPLEELTIRDANGLTTPTQQLIESGDFPNEGIREFVKRYTSGRWQFWSNQPEGQELNMFAAPTRDWLPQQVEAVKLLGHGVSECPYIKIHKPPFTVENIHDRRTMKTKNVTITYFDHDFINSISSKYRHQGVYKSRIKWIREREPRALLTRNTLDTWAEQPGWQTLKVNSHSQNQWQGYDVSVITFVSNVRSTTLKAMREQFNNDDDYIFRKRTGEPVYQAVMRTSLRDNDSDREVRIYVMDRRTAEYLKETLTRVHGHNVTLHHEPGMEVQDKRVKPKGEKWSSPAEAVRASRMVKRARNGDYDPQVCQRILQMDEMGERHRLRSMPFWRELPA